MDHLGNTLEQIGCEYQATTPATPVGSNKEIISAVTRTMSAGSGFGESKTSIKLLAVLAVFQAFLYLLISSKKGWPALQTFFNWSKPFLRVSTTSLVNLPALPAALAAPLVPNVTIVAANYNTLLICPEMIQAQTEEFLAAPIPQSTQPAGTLAQQTGPTPQQPFWQNWQHKPACCYKFDLQTIGVGSSILFFLQEMSNCSPSPQDEQLNLFGLQTQHSTGQYPGAHFGQTIRRYFQQLPFPWSFQHLLNIPESSRGSKICHGQPAPLPYSACRHQSPSSLNLEGHVCMHAKPDLMYPAGHLVQHKSPISSLSAEQPSGIVPTPLPQESFQQNQVSWQVTVMKSTSNNPQIQGFLILNIIQLLNALIN